MSGETTDARKRRAEKDAPPEEPRYTLAEAAVELARQGCSNHGHDWTIVARFGGPPVRLTCDDCGITYRVILDEVDDD